MKTAATVAAARWLEDHPALQAYSRKQHGSQWLHWSSPTQGQEDGDERIPEDLWSDLLAVPRQRRPPTTPS